MTRSPMRTKPMLVAARSCGGAALDPPREHPASNAIATTTKTLLERVNDVTRYVCAAVDQVDLVDDEHQAFLLRNPGDRVARLLDQRIEGRFLLVRERFLVIAEDRRAVGVGLGRLHLRLRCGELIAAKLRKVVGGRFEPRDLIDLRLIDEA